MHLVQLSEGGLRRPLRLSAVGVAVTNECLPDDVVAWGSATNIGAVRSRNEDAVLVEPPLFAVADGMGGHAAGDVAAGLAVDALRPLAANGSINVETIVEAIRLANATITAAVADEPGRAGMGTTLAGVCMTNVAGTAHWIVFNVGDSRVYRSSTDGFEQLTVDHSEVAELVAAGEITAEEARVHPDRNIITRALGVLPAPAPDVWVIPAEAGETFLICSDGLTTEVTDDDIADILIRTHPAQQTADELCRCALEAGGRDNISVIIVRSAPAVDAAPSVDVATGPRPSRVGEI